MANLPSERLRVTYLELCEAPASVRSYGGAERIGLETLTRAAYLNLYSRVGAPLRWDLRLLMPPAPLDALLTEKTLRIYVARKEDGEACGFCEFDRRTFPEIELEHFGLVPEAQGHGLGPWLLYVALRCEWESGARRIWLHTDTWDHPAALSVYQRAGFQVYDVRDEPADSL